ncbi:MAG: hypothetical protein WC528_00240 [Patescibacteria group bacterium]
MAEKKVPLIIKARIFVTPVMGNTLLIVHPLIIEHEVISLEIEGEKDSIAIRRAIQNGKIIQFPVFSIPQGEPGRNALFMIGLAVRNMVRLLSDEFPVGKTEIHFSFSKPFRVEGVNKVNQLVIERL